MNNRPFLCKNSFERVLKSPKKQVVFTPNCVINLLTINAHY